METKNALDNTLRYLYSTFRNREVSLVAIEFKHGGKQWRADTIEEAIELSNRLDEEDRIAIMAGDEPNDDSQQRWTPDVTTELLQSLGDYQKAFLKALYESRTWLQSDQIVKQLSLDSEVSLAGVLSGLSKQSKGINIMPWHLYEIQVSWKGKSKTRSFKMTTGFRGALDEIGWPETWI